MSGRPRATLVRSLGSFSKEGGGIGILAAFVIASVMLGVSASFWLSARL